MYRFLKWAAFAFTFLALFPHLLLAQEAETDPDNIVDLFVGESQVIVASGVAYTSVDPSLVKIEEMPPDRIRLTGLAGGKTKIIYWVGETLKYITVQVSVPESLRAFGYQPQFSGHHPYFQYSFSNSSGFTDKTFFQSPSYGHGLSGNIPLWGNAGLTAVSQMQHLQGFEQEKVTHGLLVYSEPGRTFTAGKTSASMGLESPVLAGGSFLGGNLLFRSIGADQKTHQWALFGGPEQPADMRDPTTQNQLYGINYTLFIPRTNAITSDYFNISTFAYQVKNSFEPGFITEHNTHLSPTFTLGSSLTKGDGGYALVAKPVWQRERELATLRHAYVNSGLVGTGSSIEGNDKHNTRLTYQKISKNLADVYDFGLSHDLSLRRGESQTGSSSGLSGQFSFRRSRSYRNFWSLQYSGSRTETTDAVTVTNGTSGTLAYPVGKNQTLSHGLGGTITHGGTSPKQATTDHTFSFENKYLRADSLLSFQTLVDQSNRESLTFRQSLQANSKKVTFQLSATYQETDLRDGLHHLQVSPVLQFYPTSLHQFSVSGATNFTFGNVETVIGNLSLAYQYFFGPGVISDPLWKRLILGGLKAPVEGSVFIDNNYNFYLDEGDTPVEGVLVLLDGKKERSGKNGDFLFDRISDGKHTLKILRDNIPLQGEFDYSDIQTFNTNGRLKRTVAIPLQIPKAEIYLRILSDINDNLQYDEGDQITPLPTVFLISPDGETKTIYLREGGSTIKGLEPGVWKLALNPIELPDDQTLIGALEQKVEITDYQQYEVSFLFSPIRALRGQIKSKDQNFRPSGLSVRLGPYHSSVDSKGYYWFKKLSPGTYPLTIRNLPKKFCVEKDTPESLQVPDGPFTEHRDIFMTTECLRE